MRVLLCGRFGAEEELRWRAALAQACPEVTWVTADAPRAAVDAAVVANPPPGALSGWCGLKLIQSLWAGVDRLLEDPELPEGVPIARMVDPAMTAAMAETALWATLALQRGFFTYARQQRLSQWRVQAQRRAGEFPILVLGLGEMGSATAERLAAQGYPVTAWHSSDARAGRRAPRGVVATAGRAALQVALGRAQAVVNLLPLTPSTSGLLDRRFFAALPPDAGIVNLARGAHLVEGDLLEALDSGAVGHAVLDVFHVEPLPADHPFWSHPRVTLLPHAAALTDPRSAAVVVADNLRRLRAGEPLLHVVDRRRGY
jgi:glyoxylate/hydroxypyruvate reductase A